MTREEWIEEWATLIVGEAVQLAFGEGPPKLKVCHFVETIKGRLALAYRQAQPPIINGEKKHESNGNGRAQVPAQAQRGPASNGRV